MRTSRIGRQIALILSLLAACAMTLPLASQAAPRPPKTHPLPHVSTGGARYVLATSAQLTAVINPNGQETSYFFEWGPTTAYGSRTPTEGVGGGTAKVKVGKAISGLQSGVTYHFRVVALYGVGGVVNGRDHAFAAKGSALTFELPKIPQVVVGTPFVLSGTLRGLGGARHPVVLQASPYPYREAFTTIGAPGLTDAAGRFSFRVANLSTSTAFRVITLDTRPIYSPVVTVHAAVHVTLSVRSSGHTGLVRLYGTVSPAEVGAQVLFQLRKPIKPGKPTPSEATTRFVSQFTTIVKKGGRAFSRFSIVVNVLHTGRYRAFVKLHPGGALASSASQTVVLHAGPTPAGKGKRKK